MKHVPNYSLFAGHHLVFRTLLLLMLLPGAFTHNLYAQKRSAITVGSLEALQTAINTATPGAIITLADGNYTAGTDINITQQGTAGQPITIQAQTTGGATINGDGGFNIAAPAAYIIIKGFRFTHQASHTRTNAGTAHCRFTRNIFETPGDGENLLINGNDHQVDYNTFQHKDAMGRFIAVRGTGSQIAERLWIHHNYFFDHKRQKGNGAESLQFGLSGFSLSSSNSIVEYNLFEQCDGESELISVKASAVTLRYNTIRDCPAHFTLRHGNHCQVYGNYFFQTPGLRIFGDDHLIHSNYFANCNPAINIGNGGAEVADGAPLTSHDRPDRDTIVFNTLVDNKQHIIQNPRNNGIGATQIIVAHNIIQGGGIAAKISGPFTGGSWTDNTVYQVDNTGDMPADSYITRHPGLHADKKGIFHLRRPYPANLPAASVAPLLLTDMDGQPRKKTLDAGADQFSKAAVTAWPLDKTQVGAMAKEQK